MIYNNTAELVDLLKRENLWAQKKLGQNFLVNPEVLKNIIKAAELTKDDHVVEIGPGLGILTEQLTQHAGKVTAVELDRGIIPTLQKNLAKATNLEVLHQDALKYELPTTPYKLVANIPYYITSPILNHFLSEADEEKKQMRPSIIVLLVQKEVAQKICVKDGDQTILSLEVQAFGKPSIVCTVGRNSFFPQPNVDSVVIKIQTFPKPRISNSKIFFKLIKAAFSQKRKKISNTLPPALKLTQEQEQQLFADSKISPDLRPQNISLDKWEALIQAYEKISKLI